MKPKIVQSVLLKALIMLLGYSFLTNASQISLSTCGASSSSVKSTIIFQKLILLTNLKK
jgi:Tfp pilus assembly protein PilO